MEAFNFLGKGLRQTRAKLAYICFLKKREDENPQMRERQRESPAGARTARGPKAAERAAEEAARGV